MNLAQNCDKNCIKFERNELFEWNDHMRYLIFIQSLKQIISINTDFYIIEPWNVKINGFNNVKLFVK